MKIKYMAQYMVLTPNVVVLAQQSSVILKFSIQFFWIIINPGSNPKLRFYFHDPDFGMSVNMALDMAVVC